MTIEEPLSLKEFFISIIMGVSNTLSRKTYIEGVRKKLLQAYVFMKPEKFVGMSLLIIIGLGLIVCVLSKMWFLGILGFLVGFKLTDIVVGFIKKKRTRQEETFWREGPMEYSLVVNGEVILDKLKLADNYSKRLKGLLGRSSLTSGEGLIIRPCNSIHTYRMKFAIDVLYIDKKNIVLKVVDSIKPDRLGPLILKSAYVIEASAGAFRGRVKEGDRVHIVPNE
ncbi:MAG TPA: hypothetical protein DIT39_03530 [Tissierellales bacterium]|nr:hypothetical protein [Tissierellales bacterium]